MPEFIPEVSASWWFILLLVVFYTGAVFAFASWHRGRYPAKHERIEVQFGAWLKNLPDDLEEAESQLNERLDIISAEAKRQAERKRQQLIDLFHKARG